MAQIYRANITQNGTDAPEVTVFENSLGSIVWTRSSEGIYYGTLTGAFAETTTHLLVGSSVSPLQSIVFNFSDNDTVVLETKVAISGGWQVRDGILWLTSILITVSEPL